MAAEDAAEATLDAPEAAADVAAAPAAAAELAPDEALVDDEPDEPDEERLRTSNRFMLSFSRLTRGAQAGTRKLDAPIVRPARDDDRCR